jgi:hypothetical protein
MNVLVFERGSGKYVRIDDQCQVIYTSDAGAATAFSDKRLRAAHEFFEDFVIYQRTMLAVPIGTNKLPMECDTVTIYLAELQERENAH